MVTKEGKTIMLIDDDEMLLESISEYLEDTGLHVISASDDIEIEELMADNEPDLLVLDYKLPHTTGTDIAKRLKSSRTDVPIVIMSAYDDIEEQVRESGADHYLPKPFSMSRLVKVINQSIKSKRVLN